MIFEKLKQTPKKLEKTFLIKKNDFLRRKPKQTHS